MRPSPGWIEGFKMAEPVILAYGQGMLPDFPAAPDAAIDVVPVDVVVGALVAAAASPPAAGRARLVPGRLERPQPAALLRPLRARARVLLRPPAAAARARLARGPGLGLRRRDAAGAAAAASPSAATGSPTGALPVLPAAGVVRRASTRLDDLERRLRSVRRLSDLYQSYTQAELVYDDRATLALHEALSPEDRELFGCDVAAVDWRHYLVDLHCPSVTGLLRWAEAMPARALPARRTPEPDPAGRTVAAFDMDGTLLPSTVVEALVWVRLADTPRSRWPRELARLLADLPRLLAAERHSRVDASCGP